MTGGFRGNFTCENASSITHGHNQNRDMAMRRIFWGFCINRFGIGPLHYISSHSNFGFKFAEIFVNEKRFPDSESRGVDKIAYI
jgi:hypothetical protein